MESPEDRGENAIAASTEDTSQLNRNRSFKSKQLVRSKAIREAASPPRTVSPAVAHDSGAVGDEPSDGTDVPAVSEARTLDRANASSHEACASDVISYSDSASDDGGRKQTVEIQITGGAWEAESHTEQRQRAKRWLGHNKPPQQRGDAARDQRLLSNNPRVACVCGACGNCPHCRGRKRKHACPTKQDSGIVCSDDCADCSDSEQTGDSNEDGTRNNDSLDVNDQVFYCRCPEKKDKPKSISLSRTESDEKQEPTGLDLVNFIKETLNKNARDRITLLKIEKELHALVNDTGRCIVRFPVMTSYGRMLVHRCAALFQLSHHLDQTNKTSVLVSKSGTSGGRIPCTRFREWCTASFPPPASPQRGGGAAGAGGAAPGPDGDSVHAKCILKRSAWAGADAGGALATRSKSLEQRERDYERVRRRIFSTDNCSQDESSWPWLSSGTVKLLAPEGNRSKLQKVQSLETSSGPKGRGPVSKSHSFGGYGGGGGGGGGGAPDPPPPRLLSRQGDLASSSWRVSPSSSGYKTLSLRSTDSVTPSPTGDHQPQSHSYHHHHHHSGDASPEPALVWAVTDLAAVPPGALVIHPQTGRPLTNPDGSLYHFDPARPPPLPDLGAHLRHAQHKTEESGEKRRGKLEKQQSFIDNESECRQVDECPSKCCCECRRRATQLPQQTDQKVETQPSSPCKSRYDPTETPTNPSAGQEPANHRQYDTQRQDSSQRYEVSDQTPPKYDNSTIQNYNDHRAYDITAPRPYETTNHRASNESANQRAGKLTNQESVEAQYMQQNYVQGYRNDEITSPSQAVVGAYPAQAQAEPPGATLQGAGSPAAYVHPLDPHIRPVSLTNMVYPNAMPHNYAYVNQYRMVNWYENPQQEALPAVYPHPAPHTAPPDHKQHHDTFRIDPSYPYAAELGACGACCPDAARTRGYNVSFGGLEAAPAQPPPPPAGLVLPQPHLQYQQYQEAMQWAGVAPPAAVAPAAVPAPPAAAKLYLQELYPLLQYPAHAGATVYPHPHTHPHYNLMYPQMVPQPYPVCQPVYPLIDKPEVARRGSVTSQRQKRTSVTNSSRTTPLQTPPEAPYGEAKGEPPRRQTPNEIAAKIQQINEQMSQLGVRSPPRPRDDWRRGNTGTGLLGSCPAAAGSGGRPVNDESQLSTAARAIVDSIRNMQAKNNSFKYQDGRHQQEGAPPPPRSPPRPERERRRAAEQGARARPAHPPPAPCRPPYLQMSPGTWCRRSPGPVHPVLNHPRRQHPDPRNGRR